ncbi:ABC transporter permease [Trueperella sp. LYQ143]|uniref:ABC transporter permease n=1 Tax=unclassified Trueperella TaxID=2630174 RepID=UPI0039833F8C
MRAIEELRGSRELIANLTLRELKGKYKRTLLGQLWSLANPLAQMLIYTAVFAFVMRVQPDPGNPSGLDLFALWLMCGLLPWSFFTNVVNGGMGALTGNENLIKKVYFPRVVLIYSTTLSFLYSWMIEMIVLLAAIIIFGGHPLFFVPIVILVMLFLACFSTGIALLFSIGNVYFRDIQHFSGILFQIWFYATPIVYPARLLFDQAASHNWHWLTVVYSANPLYQFGEVFRNLMYDNRLPGWENVAYIIGVSLVTLIVGYWVFKRHEDRLAEAL